MRNLLLISLLLLVHVAIAQNSLQPGWTLGLKAYYGDNRHEVEGVLEHYHISTYQESPDNFQLGLYVKACFPSLSIRPELSYSSTSFLLRLRNLRPGQAAANGTADSWRHRRTVEQFRELELYFPLNRQMGNYLSVELGPVIGRRLRSGGRRQPGDEEQIVYSLRNSYRNWNFDWRAAALVEVGPVTFQMAYQANIIPMGREVNHAGHVYQLRQQSSQLMFGVGLQMFQL
jgi:hypothetical protein